MTEAELVAKIDEIQADYHRQAIKAVRPYLDQLNAIRSVRTAQDNQILDSRYFPGTRGGAMGADSRVR